MKPHHRLIWFVLPCLLSAGLLFCAWPAREPVYDGKSLSEWMIELGTESDDSLDLPEYAVRQMGTNALPALLRMIRSRDSRFKLKLMELAAKQSLIPVHFTPASARQWRAIWAFRALGPAAVPALTNLLGDPNATVFVRQYAAVSLGQYENQAKAAVPALLQAVNDPDAQVRTAAAASLKKIDPEAVVQAGVK